MSDNPVKDEMSAKILERLDQLDQKVSSEIRQLDGKFTGEIQAARKEARDFHNAANETWGHFRRVLENIEQKTGQKIEAFHREWQEHQRMALEIWHGTRQHVAKNDQRMLDDENLISRLVKEIEDLKKRHGGQKRSHRRAQK